MKKQNNNSPKKKLDLRKRTVVRLDDNLKRNLLGGGGLTDDCQFSLIKEVNTGCTGLPTSKYIGCEE